MGDLVSDHHPHLRHHPYIQLSKISLNGSDKLNRRQGTLVTHHHFSKPAMEPISTYPPPFPVTESANNRRETALYIGPFIMPGPYALSGQGWKCHQCLAGGRETINPYMHNTCRGCSHTRCFECETTVI